LFAGLASERAQRLSVLDKLILVYLIWRQGSNGSAWPSLDRIAADLGVDRRAVVRSIKRLVVAELVQKQPGHAGRGHVNRYQILFGEMVTTSPLLDAGKGDNQDAEKVTTRRAKGGSQPLEVIREVTREGRGATRARTPSPRKPFAPPTVEEVREYAASRGQSAFDAERFVGHYANLDWHDVAGHPVQDWMRKVDDWLQRDAEQAAKSQEESDREDAEIDAKIAYGVAHLVGGQS
jgi:hypothetical protein